MSNTTRNVDGGVIKDAGKKQPGCLLLVLLFLAIPIMGIAHFIKRIFRGRYWRLSDRDYDILQRKKQRQQNKKR